MDKCHILEEIKRATEENHGEPLGVTRFSQQTGQASGLAREVLGAVGRRKFMWGPHRLPLLILLCRYPPAG